MQAVSQAASVEVSSDPHFGLGIPPLNRRHVC